MAAGTQIQNCGNLSRSNAAILCSQFGVEFYPILYIEYICIECAALNAALIAVLIFLLLYNIKKLFVKIFIQ